jgi:hypothetical protein
LQVELKQSAVQFNHRHVRSPSSHRSIRVATQLSSQAIAYNGNNLPATVSPKVSHSSFEVPIECPFF